MTRLHRTFAATVLAGSVAAGCAGTGLGDEARADIRARMGSIQEPISRCYETALTRNRKLRGSMLVAFVAAHETGKFTDVRIARSDVPDPELERCVIAQVSTLKLAKPTKTKLQIEYPFDFAWTE
jgi:hypothetical protein